MINKIASAVYNNVQSGLAGITSNPTISQEQIEEDVILERLQIIKEYAMRNLVPKKDLLVSINCIPVDCDSLSKCPCEPLNSEPTSHFEIPQILNDLPGNAIEFIGSVNRQIEFKVYTSNLYKYHKYKKRPNLKPYVYIDTTPNTNNMYDGWIFNAPLIEMISFEGIIKDPRQLIRYSCCNNEMPENFTFISTEIIKRLSEKYLRYYRQLYIGAQPNNQVPK